MFVVAIGGTGMRCAESLVHLCAMGMLDDMDLHLLALDTDRDNGNFRRLKDLVREGYAKVKGVDTPHAALKDTLFSSSISLYEFSPHDANDTTFEQIFKYGDAQYRNRTHTDVADLLFSRSVRTFDLKHGYRAQTHLGSMLMYHGILRAIRTDSRGDLRRYVEHLLTVAQTSQARVFILGSVFGGTGASSIPIIPAALERSVSLVAPGQKLDRAAFGATLLTGYFTFKLPSDEFRRRELVVATSDRFSVNSQAALMFYQDDPTVQRIYQRFYLLGTPGLSWKVDEAAQETTTGGQYQENAAHFIELLSASAALDFFRTPEEHLASIKRGAIPTEYLYRTLEDPASMTFNDFVGSDREAEFAKKMGILTATSLLCNLPTTDFCEQIRSGNVKNVQGYEDLDPRQIAAVKKYFDLYHFRSDDAGRITDGWLRQLARSTGGSGAFLVDGRLYGCATRKDLERYPFHDGMYPRGTYEQHKFGLRLKLRASPYDTFLQEFLTQSKNEIGEMPNKFERLLKHVYRTLVTLYKF